MSDRHAGAVPGYRLVVGYTANVLRVMIASPSDIPDARDAVETAIHGWNDANAQTKQTILQPWRWETAAVPVLGDHPQSLINAQSVDQSDIVFALFGSRLGSPTAAAVSGTVEEIERAVDQGKPVHLYFSTAPLPNDVDTAQLEGLRAFRKEIETRGLLGEFSNPSQLEHEVWKAVEFDIPNLGLGVPALTRQPAVDFHVQPQQQREVSGYDKRGKPRYTTRHWFDVTNRGTADAKAVIFEVVGEQSSLHIFQDDTPTVVHAGQTRQLNGAFTMGGDDPPILRIKRTEDGEPRQRDFHVG